MELEFFNQVPDWDLIGKIATIVTIASGVYLVGRIIYGKLKRRKRKKEAGKSVDEIERELKVQGRTLKEIDAKLSRIVDGYAQPPPFLPGPEIKKENAEKPKLKKTRKLT